MRTWAARLAAKLAEQIDRAESGSTEDSDDDVEATGALLEFLDDLEIDPTDDRVAHLKSLHRLIDPD